MCQKGLRPLGFCLTFVFVQSVAGNRVPAGSASDSSSLPAEDATQQGHWEP